MKQISYVYIGYMSNENVISYMILHFQFIKIKFICVSPFTIYVYISNYCLDDTITRC